MRLNQRGLALRNSKGFTLVEIMIALSVFSAALVVLTISFIGLVRTQRIAGEDRSTLQNSRKIIEEIVRDVRAADSVEVCANSPAGVSVPAILVDGTKLYYRANKTAGALMVADADGCDVATGATPRELTSRNVEVDKFDLIAIVDSPDPTPASYAVDVNLSLKSGDSVTNFHTLAATRGSN